MIFDREMEERLRSAWRDFQAGRPVESGAVRPLILRSWERCRSMNVDFDNPARQALNGKELEKALEENRELIEVSHSIMERLYESLRGTGSFISLSDRAGVVLFSLWDKASPYPIPHIAPGYLAAESSSGTNAIGTCIVEKAPVETFAEEHYCRVFHNWFCSAAPVFDAGNRVAGVLNVTLPAADRHRHTGGMMSGATCAISEQLRLRGMLREQNSILEMLDEGVIVLDDAARVKLMNNRACAMLGLKAAPVGRPLEDVVRSPDILRALMAENGFFRDQEAMLQLDGGSFPCMLSLTHVPSAAIRVVTLRSTRRIKESVARVTGAKAVYTFDHIVGESSAMKETVRAARLAARSHATTLILGESGTGKELFAQAIHNGGPRAVGPFVVVNCGALPRDLVQSELFGYDEGAFTGASRLGKPGKFELADNGTIFLDEIGEMPLDAQVSLLRLLQNGEVTRVGGKTSRKVSVRVIAATNKNLQEAIATQAFRADLYYRLNVFPLQIPPLSARTGDIPLLARHFLHKFSAGLHKKTDGFTRDALCRMNEYTWPGNIRELENVVERAVNICAEGCAIDTDSLPPYIGRRAEGPAPEGTLHSGERANIIDALRKTGGNMRAAAAILGVSRGGLYVKIKRFGLKIDDFR